MSDDYINKITFLLRSRGIDEYRFERLTRSRAVVIPDNGRVCRLVFPLGGADWRGPANLIANLRHALGPFETKAPLGVRAVSSVSGAGFGPRPPVYLQVLLRAGRTRPGQVLRAAQAPQGTDGSKSPTGHTIFGTSPHCPEDTLARRTAGLGYDLKIVGRSARNVEHRPVLLDRAAYRPRARSLHAALSTHLPAPQFLARSTQRLH